MATKQLMPNQCMPLHFIYGANDCCLCNARTEFDRFKAMVKDDMASLLSLLPEYSHTRKLMSERYGLTKPDVDASASALIRDSSQ